MKLTYYGHSCFLLETGHHRLLTDPFLTGNPLAAIAAGDVQCDFILLSHGHADHVGDTGAIARRTGATIIANYEIAMHFARQDCKVHPLYHGGGWNFPFGRVKMTIAHHGSGLEGPGGGDFLYLGNPGGFVITTGGKNLYFAGDTALFLEMRLIGEMHPLDLALLPIGDNFTMGTEEAVRALELLRARQCVPMHYNTFDLIKADPHAFAQAAAHTGTQVEILAPGQSLAL